MTSFDTIKEFLKQKTPDKFYSSMRWGYKSIHSILNRNKKTALHLYRKVFGNKQKYHILDYEAYISWMTKHSKDDFPSDYVAFEQVTSSKEVLESTKLIAFYLPQFHPLPINDEWYGKGFTEWTNVTKAIPHYTGHYQPQLPINEGFYSLLDINVMRRQADLARHYGIYGFCFHYYWFSGVRLMEKPIFNWLDHPEIDFPFCLNWANENWSKLWDGGNADVKYRQELRNEDDEKFFADILPFFQDPRYIRVNNRPMLLIYRPQLFEQDRVKAFASVLRSKARDYGFDDLFLVSVNSHNFRDDPALWGLDAMAEFPPHGFWENGIKIKELSVFKNPEYRGQIWDGKEYVESKKYLYECDYKLFKGVCPSWDNSPRRAYQNSIVIDGITPAHYKQWLEDCIAYTNSHHPPEHRFIFINAWNEWAEGCHLEPDRRYGYAYLQATKDALSRR